MLFPPKRSSIVSNWMRGCFPKGAIEGRVEIDQINTLVLAVAPENIQIVAIVQRVGSHTGIIPRQARIFYLATGISKTG